MKQLLLSGYVFAFRLPHFLVSYLGTGGNMSFHRGFLSAPHGKSREEFNAAEAMAAILGPGVKECSTETATSRSDLKSERYGSSVFERAKDPGEAFWHKTAYYRDGVGFDPWVKSLEAITDLYNIESDMSSPGSAHRRRSSSASSALFTEHFKGSLRAPTTVVWGEADIALSRPICIDGIGDYLAKGSEVILLPRAGHWTPVEKESRAILAKIVKSLIRKNQSMPSYLFEDVKDAYSGSQLLIKR
jgi:pimeloyl-ACP methyl ester carboxylesterase